MKDATDITMILDRSGSMASIRNDTLGGINAYLAAQRATPGDCRFTLITFDDRDPQFVVRNAVPIAEAKDVTHDEFVPRGWTPLYDAVGTAITNLGERLSITPADERPDKVIVVIVTDGEENRSRQYTQRQVFDMIEHQTNVYQWQFVYIGANQDALKVGQGIGIPLHSSLNYTANDLGTRSLYASLGAQTMSLRSGRTSNIAWTDDDRAKQAAAAKKRVTGRS